MPLSNINIGQIDPPLLRYLDTVWDGSGTHDFIGDYSLVPTQAIIKPPDNQIFVLTEFLVQYSDAGKFLQSAYASLAGALVNGVEIAAYDRKGNAIFSLTPSHPVITNDLWVHLGYNVALQEWGTAATTTLTAKLKDIDFGTAFSLNGNKGEYLKVSLSDDFSGMIDQSFLVKGYIKT